jgi:hypothetical protein
MYILRSSAVLLDDVVWIGDSTNRLADYLKSGTIIEKLQDRCTYTVPRPLGVLQVKKEVTQYDASEATDDKESSRHLFRVHASGHASQRERVWWK